MPNSETAVKMKSREDAWWYQVPQSGKDLSAGTNCEFVPGGLIKVWPALKSPSSCPCLYFLQISAFFLLSNFRKGRLLYIRPVGCLVGVTINFFNIYKHKSPLLTQYHSIPISPKLYWPSTTKLQPVSPHTDPLPSNTNQYCPVSVKTQYYHTYIMISIAMMSIDHNSNKRFALFTWSSFHLF